MERKTGERFSYWSGMGTNEMGGSFRDEHCTSTIVWRLAAAVVRLADLKKLRQVRF